MAKTFQVNFTTRMRDSLNMTLLCARVKTGMMSLLTVRGRKSGQPHTSRCHVAYCSKRGCMLVSPSMIKTIRLQMFVQWSAARSNLEAIKSR